jgi:hypothetical protein
MPTCVRITDSYLPSRSAPGRDDIGVLRRRTRKVEQVGHRLTDRGGRLGDLLVKPLMQLDDGFLHVLILCIAEPGLRTAR